MSHPVPSHDRENELPEDLPSREGAWERVLDINERLGVLAVERSELKRELQELMKIIKGVDNDTE